MTFRHSLLLLVGVLSIVPVFCGLVGRGSLGGVCHHGEVVGYRDASRDDPFHGCRKSSRSHAHDAWRVSREGGHKRKGRLSSGPRSCQALALPFLWNGLSYLLPPKQGESYIENLNTDI